MAIISKPTTFTTGVILAAEHNANFDTLYTEYNGNISNANIATGAGITYLKLSLGTSILNADIVAAAGIPDSKLAGITTANTVNLSSLVIPGQKMGDILYTPDGTNYDRIPIGTHFQSLTVGWDDYTKLISHFDGADAATSYTAETGQTVTFVGSAQLDTDQKKFGTSSLLLDGVNSYVTLPDSDDWNLGSGDFTIDYWVRFGSLQQCSFYSQQTDVNNLIYFGWEPGLIDFRHFTASVLDIDMQRAWIPVVNTWYHIAISKSSNVYKMFVDGTQVGTSYTDTTAITDFTGDLRIGVRSDGEFFLNGWIDEFRISKGIARWTTDFTPPTSPYFNLSWKT